MAGLVNDDDLDKSSIYPPLSTITECSVKIATKVVDYAYKQGNTTLNPKPDDTEAFVRAQMYNTNYQPAIPSIYAYPKL